MSVIYCMLLGSFFIVVGLIATGFPDPDRCIIIGIGVVLMSIATVAAEILREIRKGRG